MVRSDRADLGPADGDVDGHGVQDQCGPVVDDALGAQHGQGPAGQLFRQTGHGGRVGGGEHGAEDRCRVRFHTHRSRRPRDRDRGDDHQGDGGHEDDAQVLADLAKAGVQALPIEDRRQEQQQHDLAVDPHIAEKRDQTQQRAEQDEQNRGTHAVAPAQDRTQDDGADQRDDDLKPKHQPILPYGASFMSSRSSLRRSSSRRSRSSSRNRRSSRCRSYRTSNARAPGNVWSQTAPANQAVVTARVWGGCVVGAPSWPTLTVHTGAERSMQVPAPWLGSHRTATSPQS